MYWCLSQYSSKLHVIINFIHRVSPHHIPGNGEMVEMRLTNRASHTPQGQKEIYKTIMSKSAKRGGGGGGTQGEFETKSS